jgi:adenylate cyclase
MAEYCRMQEKTGRVWHALREHATHWVVGGALIAATGFAPEEWFARTVEHLHIPENALHLWNAGIDVRVLPIGLGVAFIVGDMIRRQYREHSTAALSATHLEASPAALPLPDRPSIAVLPFDNLSGDPEQEYFSDGVADDIITELSRDRALFVIARNSSFTYRGRAVDIKQVARELGVRYVVEGSVRRAAERVRVNAQLIDAETGSHIWAERYDRALEHIFAVQDEITASIVTAIQPALADAELRRVLRKPPENLGAWEAYQRGMWHVGRSSLKNTEQSKALFQRAIELDATFAPACIAMAYAIVVEGAVYATRPFNEAVKVADHWARRAVELDSTDAEAQACLGRVLVLNGNREEGFERALLALRLNPNSAMAHLNKGAVLVFDRPAEGRDAVMMALRLDPRSPRNLVMMEFIAISYYAEYDYANAAEWFKRTIARYPNDPRAYRWLAAALGQLGHTNEARSALHDAVKISPSSFAHYVRQRPPWIPETNHAHMLDGLRKAGWQD